MNKCALLYFVDFVSFKSNVELDTPGNFRVLPKSSLDLAVRRRFHGVTRGRGLGFSSCAPLHVLSPLFHTVTCPHNVTHGFFSRAWSPQLLSSDAHVHRTFLRLRRGQNCARLLSASTRGIYSGEPHRCHVSVETAIDYLTSLVRFVGKINWGSREAKAQNTLDVIHNPRYRKEFGENPIVIEELL